MPITADEMVAIMEVRELIVAPHPTAQGNWIALTKNRERVRPPDSPRDGYPNPQDAVEAAELHLQGAQERRRERLAVKAMGALNRGRYFVRPRQATVSGIQVTVFDVFNPDNSQTTIRSRESVWVAVRDAEELFGP